MIRSQLNVVENIVGAVADRRSDCHLFFWIDNLIRAVSKQKLGVNITVGAGEYKLSAQIL